MIVDGKVPFPAAEANRDAAQRRLQKFLPNAGWTYASHRNVDAGPAGPTAVSRLSPWIRHRVITEQEVLRATVSRHGLLPSQKFVEEILWRTYWKGWLELRPQIWYDYCSRLASAFQLLCDNFTVRQQFDAACRGETGIACFDTWAKQLCGQCYLHNHARMWFASIWIFTLGLPWELGADFFCKTSLTVMQRPIRCLGVGSQDSIRGESTMSREQTISPRTRWGDFTRPEN